MRKRHRAIAARGACAEQANCTLAANQADVKQRSALAAGTAIHQRFQLPHIGRTQLLARKQGLYLRENAVLRHGW